MADDVPTAVLPVRVIPAGSSEVRNILYDGQVIIKSGASYYNTTGTRTIQNK